LRYIGPCFDKSPDDRRITATNRAQERRRVGERTIQVRPGGDHQLDDRSFATLDRHDRRHAVRVRARREQSARPGLFASGGLRERCP